MKKLISLISVNFATMLVLLTLFGAPMYFAHNFAQVAGIKTESPYLLVSQIAKFPNITYEQVGEKHKIILAKQARSQAFLSVFIINNPTSTKKTYSINRTEGESMVFFGEDLKNQQYKIIAPAGSSIPISILSNENSSQSSVEFKIETD